jgi:hypothetical protein
MNRQEIIDERFDERLDEIVDNKCDDEVVIYMFSQFKKKNTMLTRFFVIMF